MKRRITVRGVIIKDQQIFGVVHKRRSGDIANYWCCPGGGLEIGEPILAGLDREMIEETGVKPVIGNLLFVQQFVKVDEEQFELFFNIENVGDYESVDISSTSHGPDEIHEFGFIDPKTVNFLPKRLQVIDLRILTKKDFYVEIINELPV